MRSTFSEDSIESFNMTKDEISYDVLLRRPDVEDKFVFMTDVSDIVIGSVLSRK